MKKIKLVISDFHLCEGRFLSDGTLNAMEDFHEDTQFIDFLNYYSSGECSDAFVELVINGDFLNLIQVPVNGRTIEELTETVSAKKLSQVIQGHLHVFEALKHFNAAPNHKITYVIGNHDLEMVWPACKKLFQETVLGSVAFFHSIYVSDGIHIEHGHMLEATNRVDPKRLFISSSKGNPILNLPWGSLFLIHVMIRMKKQRPIIDSVRPFGSLMLWCLFLDLWFGLKMSGAILWYFIRTYFTRTSNFSRLRTTFAVIRDLSLNFNVDRSATKILKYHSGIHTVIFGHSHLCRHRQVFPGKVYMNTGTWNEVTSLDLETFGRSHKLTFAYIEQEVENPERPVLRELRQWKGRWLVEEPVYA